MLLVYASKHWCYLYCRECHEDQLLVGLYSSVNLDSTRWTGLSRRTAIDAEGYMFSGFGPLQLERAPFNSSVFPPNHSCRSPR